LLLTGVAYLVGLIMAEGITAATAKHPEAGFHVATADEEAAVHHESATTDPATTDSAEVSAADELAAKRLGVFFSIYFGMTGVHAIHILGGMGVIAWLLWRALRGDFGPQFFGPVDFVGLYWHLVDLIWIYLFPLLYLIG
jgi:cytochrome c oxidase subunit 3